MKKLILILLFLALSAAVFATTLQPVEKTCALCGTKSTQTEVMSTNSFGSPDLDLRPPMMQRATMEYWVQECPHCGYCNTDIGESVENAQATVALDQYRAQLGSGAFPRLANRFLCLLLVNEGAGKTRETASNAICAAWSCDDAGQADGAVFCRKLAIERLAETMKSTGPYMKQVGGDRLLLADLARRTGDFDAARVFVEQGLAESPEDIIRKLLEYERTLIAAGDVAAHTVAEATGEK